MLKNKCCLYVIISIRFFSIAICNLLIEFPSCVCVCVYIYIYIYIYIYLYIYCHRYSKGVGLQIMNKNYGYCSSIHRMAALQWYSVLCTQPFLSVEVFALMGCCTVRATRSTSCLFNSQRSTLPAPHVHHKDKQRPPEKFRPVKFSPFSAFKNVVSTSPC